MNLRRGQLLDRRATSADVRREERGVETQIQVSRVSARDQLGQHRIQSQCARAGAAVIESDSDVSSTSDSDVVTATSDSDVVTIAGT
jgi:hypothetical protein